MTDYYGTLGVSKGATSDEIKKAYRSLAKKLHPDSKAGSGDETSFKKINEAYQVLSNPKKKQAYDQFGQNPFGSRPFGSAQGHAGPFTYTYTTQGAPDFDIGDLFGGAFSTVFGGARRRGRDLHYQLTVDFADAVRGAEHSIGLDNTRKVKIKIPRGAHHGLELKFAGEGQVGHGPRGENLPRGDLYVRVDVKEPAGITLRGSDIYIEKEIPVYDALLGAKIPTTVIDPDASSGLGKETLKIPAGTQPGDLFRLRSKGMPYLRGRGRGDAYVRIKIKIPEKLSKKEKKVLEELRQ